MPSCDRNPSPRWAEPESDRGAVLRSTPPTEARCRADLSEPRGVVASPCFRRGSNRRPYHLEGCDHQADHHPGPARPGSPSECDRYATRTRRAGVPPVARGPSPSSARIAVSVSPWYSGCPALSWSRSWLRIFPHQRTGGKIGGFPGGGEGRADRGCSLSVSSFRAWGRRVLPWRWGLRIARGSGSGRARARRRRPGCAPPGGTLRSAWSSRSVPGTRVMISR